MSELNLAAMFLVRPLSITMTEGIKLLHGPTTKRRGRGGSVGIATHYGLDGPRIESQWGAARFSAPVQAGLGTHPTSCAIGTRSFLGVKRPGRGVNHPPYLAIR
jgi:hypothetical protein